MVFDFYVVYALLFLLVIATAALSWDAEKEKERGRKSIQASEKEKPHKYMFAIKENKMGKIIFRS